VESQKEKKVFAVDGLCQVFFRFGMDISESDLAVFAFQNIFFGNDAFVKVFAEVDKRLFAVADEFAVDDPFFRAVFRNAQIGIDYFFEHFRPENFGQGFVVKKILRRFDAPQPVCSVDARAGHDDVNMRMIVESSGVSVQNRCKTRRASQFFVVFGECLQCLLNTGEHQGINQLLVFPGETAKLVRQSECDQEIRSRKALAQLIFDPLPIFVILAMRTVSMAA